MRRLGFTPLWGTLEEPHSLWQRIWYPPLKLWEWAWYHNRPNTVDNKTLKLQWRVWRSDWRHVQAAFFFFGPPGHILWNIRWPLLVSQLLAVFTVMWHRYVRKCWLDCDDSQTSYNNIMNLFRAGSFSLSLIMSVRIGRAYDRWWQARTAYATSLSSGTMLVMQAAIYFEDPRLVSELARWALVWQHMVYMMVVPSDEPGKTRMRPEGAALLSDEELRLIETAGRQRQVVDMKLRAILADANLSHAKELMMDAQLSRASQEAGNAARIHYQALPYNLSLLSTGLSLVWCLLMPLALVGSADWTLLGTNFFFAVMLLGADEVAAQMEAPFPLIPMLAYLQTANRDVRQALAQYEELQRIKREREAQGEDLQIRMSLRYCGERGGSADDLHKSALHKSAPAPGSSRSSSSTSCPTPEQASRGEQGTL